MASEHKSAKGSLSGEGKPKHHEAHVRRLHDGFHVTKHHRDGSETEHSASDIDEAMQHVQDHMEQGDDAASQDPQAQAQTGSPQGAPASPDQMAAC